MKCEISAILEVGVECMCGICGIVHSKQQGIDSEALRAMAQAMVHRGPDDDGYLVDGNIGLGFRRLSIVDLEHGHQPMANEDGTVWVVFNGEIYNHQSLRQRLVDKGHQFRTHADTEVIVHLYEEEGIRCLESLRGMFGIAIADLRTREVFLARDYFGIKPIYYSVDDGSLLFASELRSVLTGRRDKRSLDKQAVWDYFTFQYVPQPESMVEGIKKLPPAHYAHFRDGQINIHRYWSPNFQPDDAKPLSYFVEGVQHHLSESVRLHLQADVKVGSFLSSGVDSSAIVALASKFQDMMTFSVGFEDMRSGVKELDLASQTAKMLGTNHTDITVSANEFLEALPSVMASLEEPLGDPSAFGLYFVSKLATQFVTVVLSGEGADEIFGGYPIYHEPISLRMFDYMPRGLKSGLKSLAATLPYGMRGRSFLLRGSTPLERRFIGNISVFRDDTKQAMLEALASDESVLSSYHVTDPVYSRYPSTDPITRMQLLDLQTWLPGDILFKADKMTMAHSLELRVPFLDREVFDFAATIPTRYRVNEEGKYAFRQAAKAWLPSSIAQRPKLGFPVPYREWLKSWRQHVWDLFSSSSVREWFSADLVERMLREHSEGTRDHGRELWTLLTFLVWNSAVMDR